MRRVIGTKHIGKFFTIIVLEDTCFYYNKKCYFWNNILSVKRDDSVMSNFFRYPSATILLNDGVIFRILYLIYEKNKSCSKCEILYEEILNIFQKSASYSGNQFTQYLLSTNYIMVYRWLIFIGILFAIVSLFALFVLRVKYDLIMIYFTVLQLICIDRKSVV